jgi:hypothetical protein
MKEDVGFFNKTKYLLEIVVLSIFYFLWAIFLGVWDGIKSLFRRE